MPSDAIGLVEFLAKNAVLFGGPVFAVLLLYVVWRTGSAHIFRHRVWRIVHGRENLPDGLIKSFIAERTSLMAFRFNAGVRVRTLGQAHRLSVWLKENDEDISDVTAIAPYFDLEQLRLKPEFPHPKKFAWLWPVLVVGGVATVIGGTQVSWERGYFKVVSTGTNFSASVDEARGLNFFSRGEPPRIAASQCQKERGVTGGFSAQESQAICELLLKPDVEKVIQRARQEQYFLLGLMLAAFTCAGLALLFVDRRLYLAWEMKERLERKNAQLKLDI
jgi:hypothetical protein